MWYLVKLVRAQAYLLIVNSFVIIMSTVFREKVTYGYSLVGSIAVMV